MVDSSVCLTQWEVGAWASPMKSSTYTSTVARGFKGWLRVYGGVESGTVGCGGCRGGKLQAGVCEVCDGLCEGTEVRGAISPAHGQCQWEGNERLTAWCLGHKDVKMGDHGRGQGNAVKPIRQVTLQGKDQPVGGVSIHDHLEDSLEGGAKLHGTGGCQGCSGLIDPTPGVVNNGMGLAVTLWDDAYCG